MLDLQREKAVVEKTDGGRKGDEKEEKDKMTKEISLEGEKKKKFDGGKLKRGYKNDPKKKQRCGWGSE